MTRSPKKTPNERFPLSFHTKVPGEVTVAVSCAGAAAGYIEGAHQTIGEKGGIEGRCATKPVPADDGEGASRCDAEAKGCVGAHDCAGVASWSAFAPRMRAGKVPSWQGAHPLCSFVW